MLVPASRVKINRKNSLTVEDTTDVIFITYDLHVSAGRIEVCGGPYLAAQGPHQNFVYSVGFGKVVSGLRRNVQYRGVGLCVFETWVPLYQTTRLHNPDARNLNLHGFENTKSVVAYRLTLKVLAFSIHFPPL